MMNCSLKCPRQRSRPCASWCARRWRTFASSAFLFWWRLGLVRIGAMWIDHQLKAPAVHGFPHVTGVTDALNAPQAKVRPGKDRVAELQQREQADRQCDQCEEISQQEQNRGDRAKAFAKRGCKVGKHEVRGEKHQERSEERR